MRHDWRLLDWPQRIYLRGNFHAFGLWRGFWSNVYLMCPLLNTMRFWRLRDAELTFVDEQGNPLDPLIENALIDSLEDKSNVR